MGSPSRPLLPQPSRRDTMIGRQFLKLRPAAMQMVQRRGKAVSNYQRPTMDMYLAPTEAYGPANARRQSSYNMILLGGVASVIVALAAGTIFDVWEFNPYPHELMKSVKGTPINDDEAAAPVMNEPITRVTTLRQTSA